VTFFYPNVKHLLCQRIAVTQQKCPPRRKEVKTNVLLVKKTTSEELKAHMFAIFEELDHQYTPVGSQIEKSFDITPIQRQNEHKKWR
jgi:hypothetical protein